MAIRSSTARMKAGITALTDDAPMKDTETAADSKQPPSLHTGESSAQVSTPVNANTGRSSIPSPPSPDDGERMLSEQQSRAAARGMSEGERKKVAQKVAITPPSNGTRFAHFGVLKSSEVSNANSTSVRLNDAKKRKTNADKPPNLAVRLRSEKHSSRPGWQYRYDGRRGRSKQGVRRYKGYLHLKEWNQIREETQDEQTQIERIRAIIRRKNMATFVSRRERKEAAKR